MKHLLFGISAACAVTLGLAAQSNRPASLRLQVAVDPAVSTGPVSGRVIVLMTDAREPKALVEPAFADPTERTWVTATEVQGLLPGQTVELDARDVAAPEPLSRAPSGAYQMMALLDVDHNAGYATISAADLRSKVINFRRDGRSDEQLVTLTLSEHGTEPPIKLPGGGETLDFISPSLSTFWGTPTHMRAFVILPPDYARSRARYPTVYITQGFSGYVANFVDYFSAPIADGMAKGQVPPMIWVLLDESLPSGTHEFADSVNNGPWGHALTTELIPSLERRFRMDARPSGRLLNGHSSGGWATLWLQTAYPTFFGGTWSTSPDPVDFHDFLGVDLLEDDNLYRAADGTARPLLRVGGLPVLTVERFARQEAVLGEYGGQMSSFEWVFSPRGADGRPMRLFDRATGKIHREVARRWHDQYDISRKLVANSARLAGPLRGRLHLVVGTEDHFYTDRTIRRFQRAIEPLGYQARFSYLNGRNHFDLYEPDLLARIAAQMYSTARPGRLWKPRSPLDPRTELAQ